MTREEFRRELAHTLEEGFRAVYGLTVYRNSLYGYCLDLAFDEDHNVAFHAAYALEAAYLMDRDRFTEKYRKRFVEDFPKITDPSAQRHYGKIMCDLLERELVEPNEEQVDNIIEKSFDLLISETAMPAVKVWAMEILYLLSDRRDWVPAALYDTIDSIMTDSGAAIRSRGTKICLKLKRKP